jgi:Major Facilitator Superfamily
MDQRTRGGAAASVRSIPTGGTTSVATWAPEAVADAKVTPISCGLHDIGFSVQAIILAYVGYKLVYALLSYPAGTLTDRLPPAAVFGVGLAFFAVTYAGLGLTRSQLVSSLLILDYGAFTALTDGVGKAWISNLLPASVQGSGQGVFQGLSGLGVLAAGGMGRPELGPRRYHRAPHLGRHRRRLCGRAIDQRACLASRQPSAPTRHPFGVPRLPLRERHPLTGPNHPVIASGSE